MQQQHEVHFSQLLAHLEVMRVLGNHLQRKTLNISGQNRNERDVELPRFREMP